MGIASCKRILEQRNLISHVLNSRMEGLVHEKRTTFTISEPSKCNIFNETYHNAIKYCEIEREYGVYNTLLTMKKTVDISTLSTLLASQTDEYLFLKQEINLWTVDAEMELKEAIFNRLADENFNKDLRSDLWS